MSVCRRYQLWWNCLFSFHKPFSNVCPADIWTSLKEKITLMTIDLDRITVTLSACFQRCCRADIQDLFDGIFTAIFPAEASWEKISVFGEGSNNGNIDFSLWSHVSSPRSERCLRKLLLDWIGDSISQPLRLRIRNLKSSSSGGTSNSLATEKKKVSSLSSSVTSSSSSRYSAANRLA